MIFQPFQVTPPVQIYMKFYFFVVVNPREVELGLERPRLVERGPYSYAQYRRKVNISSQWEGEDFIRCVRGVVDDPPKSQLYICMP